MLMCTRRFGSTAARASVRSFVSAATHQRGRELGNACGRTITWLPATAKFSGARAHHTVKALASGTPETLEWKMTFEDEGGQLSPWHDIPLFPPRKPGLLNFVVEIPRGTRAKLECGVKEAGNAIIQDSKKGKPRYYGIDPVFNYGFFPQTWEDPNVKHSDADCLGDGDPIDVVEVGSGVLQTGEVRTVKPLGAFCMIDDGEADWKVLAVDVADPLADKLNDIGDLEKVIPGKVSEVREWFRTYKTHEGKPLNAFGLDEKAMDRAYTLKVVQQAHDDWSRLWMGVTDKGKFVV